MTTKEWPELQGKVIVVTGSTGILGTALCDLLVSAGASLFAIDCQKDRLQLQHEALQEKYSDSTVAYLAADISKKEQVLNVLDAVLTSFTQIDVLINAAATKTDEPKKFFEPFETYDLDTWRSVMSVNIDAAFLMAQILGGHMAKASRGGSVINISSIYGSLGPHADLYDGAEYMGIAINTPAVYAASKAALLGLTKYLASYWGDKSIRVNAVSPGGIYSGQNETFVEKYSKLTPVGRMADVAEVCHAIAFLASERSSYINGQNLFVDGGWSSW